MNAFRIVSVVCVSTVKCLCSVSSSFQGPMQLLTCSLQTLETSLGSITVSTDAKVYGVRKCLLNMRGHFRSLVVGRYMVSKIYV